MHSDADLNQRTVALLKKASASPTGEAGEKLDDVGSRWLLLMARVRLIPWTADSPPWF